jgi:hypothetical protein
MTQEKSKMSLSERSLVPSDGTLLGETRFEEWLIGSASQLPQPTTVAAASKGVTGL